ncbi:MAG: sigma-70 family RNA polymerase sigma factor [Elusimicrobia bacterium]|nr:sigma-70 family RNA polymerase sigma factor [Elusimicrobiota bacterium]
MTPQDLISGYQNRVYAVSLRLTGNPADASDLTQDVMLKAVAALSRFRGDSELSTWLYRIAVNTWKNRVSAAPERWRRSCPPLDAVPEPGGDSTPDGELEGREERSRAAEALARLSPEDRRVLELRELERMSYRQISRELGVPVGTVKSRLHRARESLREYVLGLGLLLVILLVAGKALKPQVSNVFNQIMGMVSGAAQGLSSPR